MTDLRKLMSGFSIEACALAGQAVALSQWHQVGLCEWHQVSLCEWHQVSLCEWHQVSLCEWHQVSPVAPGEPV